jgi:hypothetical protein
MTDIPEGVVNEQIKEVVGRQRELVLMQMSKASTLVEELADWAGAKKGAERDEAIRKVFGMIAKMEGIDQANYRTSLTDKLKMVVRDFNNVLKAAGAEVEEEEARGELVETLGGYIDGWLVEYLYDPEKREGKLAFRDPERKVGITQTLKINGVNYIPKYPGSFIQREACMFPSELGVLKDTRELVTIIEGFIRRWYLLEAK